MSLSLLRVLSLLYFFQWTLAALVNVLIDDTFGDNRTSAKIQYAPVDSWSIGGGCTQCTTQPNASQATDNTWHVGTFSNHDGPHPGTVLSATVPFFGTAIKVFCILASTARSDMTFFIDSAQAGQFTLEPTDDGSNTTVYTYAVPVFSAETLQPGKHVLEIQNGSQGGKRATILLDSITYMFDDTEIGAPAAAVNSPMSIGSVTISAATVPTQLVESATSSRHTSASSVAGAVVGTLLGVLFIVLAIYVYRRYYRYPKVLPVTSQPKRPSWFDRLLASARFSPKTQTQASSFDPNRLVARLPSRPPSNQPLAPQPRPAPLTVRNMSQQSLPIIDPPPRVGTSPVPLLAPSPAPSSHLSSFKIESIQKWQRQTLRESPQPVSRELPDMSEELSSYYEDNPTESNRVRTPPPPVRHFTVMNN